jgi:CRISPR/Cas system Type II protein with McrA/HNH and RuvC-like nuclease domain
MEKLQGCFLEVLQEKLEFRKELKELEHFYVQLSRDMNTMIESITLYKNERTVPKAQQSNFQEVSLTKVVEPTQDMLPETQTHRSMKAWETCASPSSQNEGVRLMLI